MSVLHKKAQEGSLQMLIQWTEYMRFFSTAQENPSDTSGENFKLYQPPWKKFCHLKWYALEVPTVQAMELDDLLHQ